MNNKSEERDLGPTEELRDPVSPAEREEGVPGAQNPDNADIKDEQKPNTE